MSPAQRIANHPALAGFYIQTVIDQQTALTPISPDEIRAALNPETENQYEAI